MSVGSRNSGGMTISRDKLAVDPHEAHTLPTVVRNGAAMFLAAASGATDAIGYLALGNVFTSAMTGNLALLGIALAHRDGARIGRVLVSLVCYMVGAAIGARVARSPQPDDPVRRPSHVHWRSKLSSSSRTRSCGGKWGRGRISMGRQCCSASAQ